MEENLWSALVLSLPENGRPSESAAISILKNMHATFRLLHGPIRRYIQTYGLPKLVDLLEDFIPTFVDTVDYGLQLPGGSTALFTLIQGFHYGPLERGTYMSVDYFHQRLQDTFPAIRYSCMLYQAHLITCGLALDDMKSLYNYLVAYNGIVRTTKLNHAPFGRIPTAASHVGGGSSSFGRCHLLADRDTKSSSKVSRGSFLFGAGQTAGFFAPTVHFEQAGSLKLVVFCYKGTMLVCLFEDAPLDVATCEQLRDFCLSDGESLVELQPRIAKQFSNVKDHDDEYRFLYYNKANNAFRLSNRTSARKATDASSMPLPAHDSHTIAMLYDDLDTFDEINFKEDDKGWIVLKRTLDREFFLLLDNANMTLAKSQEEVSRFCAAHFSNICML